MCFCFDGSCSDGSFGCSLTSNMSSAYSTKAVCGSMQEVHRQSVLIGKECSSSWHRLLDVATAGFFGCISQE